MKHIICWIKHVDDTGGSKLTRTGLIVEEMRGTLTKILPHIRYDYTTKISVDSTIQSVEIVQQPHGVGSTFCKCEIVIYYVDVQTILHHKLLLATE